MLPPTPPDARRSAYPAPPRLPLRALQAQQRYRAKRKAQFEELQAQVHHLSADAADARVRAWPGASRAVCTNLHACAVPHCYSAAALGRRLLRPPRSPPSWPDWPAPAPPAARSAPLQRLRQENERLRAEVARLRTMAGPPATSAAGAASQPLPLSLPDTLGPSPLPLPLPASGMSASPAKRTASGAFKPTAAARPLALSTLGGLPMPSAPAALVPAAAPLKPAAVPAKQLQAALQLYYRDLQAFATQQQLDRMPADGAWSSGEGTGERWAVHGRALDSAECQPSACAPRTSYALNTPPLPCPPACPPAAGTGLAPDVVLHLSALVHTGAELAKLILQVSGPDATSLLTADMPAAGSDGASPADSLAQWRAVAARVELSPEQRAALADWRRRFLARLDDIYGRRLLHKAALAQAPPAPAAPGQQPQWMEALLLQAAEQSGFSGEARWLGWGPVDVLSRSSGVWPGRAAAGPPACRCQHQQCHPADASAPGPCLHPQPVHWRARSWTARRRRCWPTQGRSGRWPVSSWESCCAAF